ncbi:phage terminase large subunit [Caloranaerobacter sp. DY30410]|uniref:phage terminase large subunit n=1 Tax=Caloranaerobacter sp. DY30410 TaxID=3238305 RepID=UPI003D0772E5
MINIDNYIKELDIEEDLEAIESEEYQKKLFLEYVKKNGNFPRYRQKLYEEYKAGATLSGKDGLRKKLAAIDLEYFGRAYLKHYFVRKSPDFHRELNKIWSDGVLKGLNPITPKARRKISRLKGCRRGIAAPRGHAKSTTFTFKNTIHAILYEYKHYIIILSDSSEQAEGFLGDIKVELEENRLIIEDFGNLKGKKWTDSSFTTSTNIKVDAIGSGKKIRGRRHRNWRPDLIILDDVENDENVNTPEQRRKLANWFYKAVSKAGDDYTDIIYIGTMLHYDGLLAKVLRNPAYKCVKYKGIISFAKNQSLWDAWESIFTDLENPHREEDALKFFEDNKEEMLEGTKVLWEEKLSYYDLMVLKVSEGEASFNSEIQNEPIDPDNAVFNDEWFDFYNEAEIDFKDGSFIFFGGIDPSLGKNKRSDTSAIIVLAKNVKTGYMYVYEASIEKRHPDVIINDVIESQKRLKTDFKKGYIKFGVETNQFQHFFKDVLAKESAKTGEYLPIEEIHNIGNKDMRIRSLQPYIKNKYIKFNPKHKTLLRQLKNYPMDANDDGPDCLEMVVRLAEKIGNPQSTNYMSVLRRKLSFKKGAY